MRKTILSFISLTLAAAGFSACDDDDKNSVENQKEFALQVKINLECNDSTAEQQFINTVEAALSSVGISETQPYLYINARDSADAAPKIKELGSKIEAVLDKNASLLYGNAYILAIEKQQLESTDKKQQDWSCWYVMNYPESSNDRLAKKEWDNRRLLVYAMDIYNTNYWLNAPGTYWTSEADDVVLQVTLSPELNDDAGGAYVHLVLHAAQNGENWRFRSRLITDVVMLNTLNDAHYPEYVDLKRQGQTRRYYPVFAQDGGKNGSTEHDLNDEAGGPYLWLYYTTDKRDQWVLASNSDKANGTQYHTEICTDKNRSEENFRYYVHGFKKDLYNEWYDDGIANMNLGTKGDPIYMYLAFSARYF